MTKTKRLIGLGLLTVGTVLFSAESAHAWKCKPNILGTGCVKWIPGAKMYRDRCSMPDGSDADLSYWNAGSQWAIPTAGVMDHNWWYNSGCTIGAQNGRSETALVPRSQISGANGLAQCWHWSITGYYSECDIKLANDMNYFNEDESFWNWNGLNQGRVVTVHEFGHALGLDHDDAAFAVMRTATPYPLNGGLAYHGEPFPDDALGARLIYSAWATSANVFASAQKFVGGQVMATDAGSCITFNRCRGQQMNVTYTAANNGTTSVTSGFRIFLNNSPSGYWGGYTLFNGTAFNPAHSSFTETRTLTIPYTVPNGLYWVLWTIDANGTIAESNEWDNSTHGCLTINVVC